jgi:hypothetical protein
MRELSDVHFPKAERIRVILDNLSTHSAGALYKAASSPDQTFASHELPLNSNRGGGSNLNQRRQRHKRSL